MFGRHLAARRVPAGFSLLIHELRARRGADLVLALLLHLPILGPRLRARIARGTVCAFVAFRGDDQTRVGCLLHPSRWQGTDVRDRAPFRLVPGFRCGAASFVCPGAAEFATSPPAARHRFEEKTLGLDWFSYSATAPRFSEAALRSDSNS